MVHPANIQDRDGGLLVLKAVRRLFPFIERIVADGSYQGEATAAAVRALGPWQLEIVKRSDHTVGFEVLPQRRLPTISGLMQLPGLPSDIDLLKANVTGLLAKLSKLPLEEISQQLLDTVQSANRLLKNANTTATGATGLIANLNGQVKPLSESILGTTGQADDLLKEAQDRLELSDGEPMRNLNLMLAGAHRLVDNLTHTLPLGPPYGFW